MFTVYEQRLFKEFVNLSAQRQSYIFENSKLSAQPYEKNVTQLQRRIRARVDLLTEDLDILLESYPTHILYMLYALSLIGGNTDDYLETDPVDRYASAHAFVIDFDRVQAISKLKQFYIAEFIAKALKHLEE